MAEVTSPTKSDEATTPLKASSCWFTSSILSQFSAYRSTSLLPKIDSSSRTLAFKAKPLAKLSKDLTAGAATSRQSWISASSFSLSRPSVKRRIYSSASCAAIFSKRWMPPLLLSALRKESTLSAPSKARSSWSASSAGLIARPRLAPNCRVAGAGE